MRCYQLEHAERLAGELVGLVQEVQLRRRGGEPITVFLSAEEPAKSVQVAFTVAELLGGATPGAPSYEFRRRNQTADGTGVFSAWEAIAGTELFVTPA